MKKITSLLTVVLLSASALPLGAQISFDSNVVFDNAAAEGLMTISNYAPTSGSNSILLVGYTQDGGNSVIQQATFGGNNMTLLSDNDRTQIYGYVLSDTTAGDIVFDSSTGTNTVVYGTLRNVDTSTFGSLSTATGATNSAGTFSTSALTVSSGDYVFAVFNNNSNSYDYTGLTPSAGLSELAFATPASFKSYNAGIVGGVVSSAGSYTPGVTWTGGTGAVGTPFGSAVAFTAIPEPSSFALVAGAFGALALFRRKRA